MCAAVNGLARHVTTIWLSRFINEGGCGQACRAFFEAPLTYILEQKDEVGKQWDELAEHLIVLRRDTKLDRYDEGGDDSSIMEDTLNPTLIQWWKQLRRDSKERLKVGRQAYRAPWVTIRITVGMRGQNVCQQFP